MKYWNIRKNAKIRCKRLWDDDLLNLREFSSANTTLSRAISSRINALTRRADDNNK